MIPTSWLGTVMISLSGGPFLDVRPITIKSCRDLEGGATPVRLIVYLITGADVDRRHGLSFGANLRVGRSSVAYITDPTVQKILRDSWRSPSCTSTGSASVCCVTKIP